MPEELQQLGPRLRHRSIENLHEGGDVDGVLQVTPVNPLLRPKVQDWPWPRPPLGVFLVEQLEERLGRKGLLSPWRVVLVLVPLLPGPGGGLLAPWSAVLLRTVMCCSTQGHADGLLFMAPP